MALLFVLMNLPRLVLSSEAQFRPFPVWTLETMKREEGGGKTVESLG